VSTGSDSTAADPVVPSSARREWLRALGVGLVALALSVFFFAPRFVVWTAQGVDALQYNIEIFRSPRFLHQIEAPFERITVASDQVIQWRLLFPLLGHYLHLPKTVMWLLPWVGCLLALAVAARMLWEHSKDRRLVWLGTLLAATCSWHFVATGWAFYYDGWLMAAVLLAAFARPRGLLLAAALVTPWIDERFVLTLPLCLGVRRTVLGRDENYRWRDWWRDILWLAAGSAPYLGLRLWAYGAGVWQPDYLNNTIGFTSPVAVNLEGAWFGLRAAWLPALLWPALVWRGRAKCAKVLGAGALAVLLVSVAVHVGMAGDVSRSASVAVPALLAGVMLWRGWTARWAGCALTAACAANFFLPARHVVTSSPVEPSRIPIAYLHTGLRELAQPPDTFNPKIYFMLAQQALQQAQQGAPEQQAQKIQEAFNHYSTAVGLDPAFSDALVGRGVMLFNEADRLEKAGNKTDSGQLRTKAMQDFDQAVASPQAGLAAWLNRGLARRGLGDRAGAAADLERALALAPPGWPNREKVALILAELKAGR
jgi:tetratricopeptide (TPR) repeat protein